MTNPTQKLVEETISGGHVNETHEPGCDDAFGTCFTCEMAHCKVCGGAEGSLPTECPGQPIHQDHQELIYHSTLDFRDGQWMRRPYASHETSDVGAEIIVDIIAEKLNRERNSQHPPEGETSGKGDAS
jgi:hypothetical protein